jgi:assimilatory nitrate reductase catalytic subunit
MPEKRTMTAVDTQLRTTRTTCPYCGVGCGVLATPDGRGGAAIAGDPDHPANFGRLCSKGSALGETLDLDSRVLHPMIRSSRGTLERVAWNDALDHVANRLQHIIARDGKDAVAFYLSGQLLTEDYYVANKLMKGFIGSANVDTNSRLCMASSVAGHRRAFGADTVPGCYEDLDEADLLVLVGSNTAWCHPVLFQRMLKNKQERGAKIVVLDPRRTPTADEADLFLGLKPGSDTALFSGLLVYLTDRGAVDRGYIDAHTSGFDEALARAREIAGDVKSTALATGLAEADVRAFFEMFRTTPRAVTCYSQGVNQSAQGTDKVNAIINCHLLTGRIGRTGTGPFSLTGQPNAMGGREVGGLANQLAAHMDFSPANIERVRRFWKATDMATHEGLKAVAMFDAIAQHRVRALWVMGTNPAVSLPNADVMRQAMRGLDLCVVSENVLSNDTVNSGAHVIFPAHAWGEKSGTVTNSERRISRQRRFMEPAGEAKPDWWIVSEIAKRLGFGYAFGYKSAADIFREHAALSAFENRGSRDFDIGAFANMNEAAFDLLTPFQWPHPSEPIEDSARFFAKGGFFTGDRKARFVTPDMPAMKQAVSEDFPLRLNTGRVRDQWHTMTRTGLSPRLGQHLPEPFVEVHPDDAARFDVTDGGFAQLATEYGACILRVIVSDAPRRGEIFAPIHWSDTVATHARVGSLVAPVVDPFSGQPDSKATPVALKPVAYAQQGFVLSRKPLSLPQSAWWSHVTVASGHGYLHASNLSSSEWRAWFETATTAGDGLADVVAFEDAAHVAFRAAAFADDRIDLCLFSGPFTDRVEWDAARALFEGGTLDARQRRALLSGQSTDGLADAGPTVCACFGVGRNTIEDFIQSHSGCDAAAIGADLKAGTNCGSCVPELKRLIARQGAKAPALKENLPQPAPEIASAAS